MRVAASGRSAFVSWAQGQTARIEVNQPSDCLALQRDHIACTEVVNIEVWFGYDFTSNINGTAQPESYEEWQKALHHLLNTYQPGYCYIHKGVAKTGLGEVGDVEVEEHPCYRGFWDNYQNVLSLIRYVCGICWKIM